jgi:hypothetical protein
VPNGERLRVELTPSGTTELARYLGPRVAVVEGTLTSVGGDGSMVIAVDQVQLVDGLRQPWTGEGVVTFNTPYVAGVQQRVFNRRLTTIATVAATAVLVGIAVVALKSGGAHGNPGDGTPGPTP